MKKILATLVMLLFLLTATSAVMATSQTQHSLGFISDDYRTLSGRWGVYDHPAITGDINGYVRNGEWLFAKLTLDDGDQVGYIFVRLNSGSFAGMAYFQGNYYGISGNYIIQNGFFGAHWTLGPYNGWMYGTIV